MTVGPSVEPLLYTVAQAARLTALSRSTLHRLMDAGKLTYCAIPAPNGSSRINRRIPREALLALVASTLVNAA